jgi:condensin-2 complex subunit D3
MIDQLRSNFRDLLSFIDVNDKIESDETVSSKTASSSVCLQEKLISILNILKRLEQQLIPKNDDDGCNEDNKVVDVDGGNFIRTNLANYNDKQSNAAENSSSTQQLSLRNIFESQSFVTQVLHFLTQLMNDNDNFFTDENDNDNHHNGPSFISLLACQIYLQTSLVQGSWSVGWIDMVAIRYVETTLRKWNLFCCEFKLKLSSTNDDNEDEDNELRMKRSKYNQDEENTAVDEDGDDNRSFCDRKIIHEKIQHGIELSKALSHILRQCDQCSFWNWNIEARDALFDSTILAFGTCSALLSQGFDILPTHKGVLKILCQDTVRDLCHSLEKVVISSVDEGNFAIQNNNEDTDDLDEFQSPNPIVNEENIATLLPIPRSTLVTLLRNIYPLLECKTDLPNGVKGKHATFERCQSVIAKIVQSLSSKVKMIDSSDGFSMTFKSMNGSIHTPRTKRRHDNVGDTITPLTGHREINRRLSVTPKSTNRKKILQSRNGLNTLIVAPSLKKSITPTRSSRRRSLMLQHSYSALSSKNTQRKKKDEIKDMHIKEMLDILVGLMQKISTCSNMERVEVRTRISAFNSCMLENMRGFYRNPFIKFLTKLTNSKVSTHRIFSVELLCSILSTQWFWDDECIHKKRNDRMNLSVDEEENESEVVSSIDVKQSNNSNEFPKNQSISFSIGEESNKRTLVSKEIFDALQGRITDRSPAVRARVAIALSAAFGDLKSLVSESNDIQTIILNSINSIRSTLISSLRQRAKCDTKATVRRAASMAFVDLILISESDNIVGGNEFNLTQIDINVLCQLCSDSSVAVRKVAVDAIVKLMERQHCHSESHLKYEIGSLESAWVDSILPLVRDVEHSCVAKVIDSFETLIVAPIVEIEDDFLDDEKTRNTDRRHMSFWKIMCILNHESASSGPSTGSKNAFKLVMRKAFEVLDTQKRKRVCVTILRKLHAVVSSNVNHNEDSLDEKVTGAWCMLESIASLDSNMNMKPITNLVDVLHVSNIGTDFLTLSCNSLLKRCNEENIESKKTTLVACAKSCINVVSSFARVMEAEQITELALVLKNAIKSFALVIDLIGLSTTALVALADALCSGKTDNAIVPTCTKWIQE